MRWVLRFVLRSRRRGAYPPGVERNGGGAPLTDWVLVPFEATWLEDAVEFRAEGERLEWMRALGYIE